MIVTIPTCLTFKLYFFSFYYSFKWRGWGDGSVDKHLLQKHERLNSNSPHHVNAEWVQRLICNAEFGRWRQGTPRANRLVRLAAFRPFWETLTRYNLGSNWGQYLMSTSGLCTQIYRHICMCTHTYKHALHNTHMKIKKELGVTPRDSTCLAYISLWAWSPALQRLCLPKTESSMFFTSISYGGGS